MRIRTNSGKSYSLSTKNLLKGIVRWFIKLLYIYVDKLKRLAPDGNITLSLVFDAYIFDYLFMKEDKILDK